MLPTVRDLLPAFYQTPFEIRKFPTNNEEGELLYSSLTDGTLYGHEDICCRCVREVTTDHNVVVFNVMNDTETAGSEACKRLADFVNNMCHKKDDFMNTFRKEHSTLKADMFSLALLIIGEMSKEQYAVDGRTTYVQRCASDIVNSNKDYFN